MTTARLGWRWGEVRLVDARGILRLPGVQEAVLTESGVRCTTSSDVECISKSGVGFEGWWWDEMVEVFIRCREEVVVKTVPRSPIQ